MRILYVVLLALFFQSALYSKVSVATHVVDPHRLAIEVTFELQPEEVLYKDFIDFSVNSPDVTLTDWHANQEPVTQYDITFKDTKTFFVGSVVCTLQAVNTQADYNTPVALSVIYYTSSTKGYVQELFPLAFNTQEQQDSAMNNTDTSALSYKKVPQAEERMSTRVQERSSFSDIISDVVKKTDSMMVRLILVFLLGVLLSLTPCIYPMIPITIGILQSQGNTSLGHNFLVALVYTVGMATTFAALGLLAGCAGPVCGQLLMEPLFIAGLVIVLLYLALSMLGLYELYIPRIMRPANKEVKSSSLFSIFLFGAASGTISSPCVSPGLALLLSVVATLGNGLLGFLLLFVFGIGLSMPLLLVGTFSSSLNMLPRAGMWMIEVKKIFGFMMFFMIFYYMSYVVPLHIIWWLVGIFVLVVGVHYIYRASYASPMVSKRLYALVGIILVATSVVIVMHAYKQTFYSTVRDEMQLDDCWHTDYQEALAEAKRTHKLLFIDCWAKFCSICIAINKGLLHSPTVVDYLRKEVVALKVDGTFGTNKPYDVIQQTYHIIGFPTFLLIDPHSETVIKKWGGELYSMTPEAFIAQLRQ